MANHDVHLYRRQAAAMRRITSMILPLISIPFIIAMASFASLSLRKLTNANPFDLPFIALINRLQVTGWKSLKYPTRSSLLKLHGILPTNTDMRLFSSSPSFSCFSFSSSHMFLLSRSIRMCTVRPSSLVLLSSRTARSAESLSSNEASLCYHEHQENHS